MTMSHGARPTSQPGSDRRASFAPPPGRSAMLVAAAILAGCASSAEQCDATNPGSLFTASSCVYGGGFDARIAQIRADTQRMIDEAQLTRQEAAELDEQARIVRAQHVPVRTQLAEAQSDLDVLRLQLDSVSARTAENQARLDQLRSDLARLEQERDRLAAQAGSSVDQAAVEQEIQTLNREIAERRAIYNRILNTISSE